MDTAQSKHAAFMAKVQQSPVGKPDYPDNKALISYAKAMDYSQLLQHREDVQPAGREKVVCASGGVVAPVCCEWLPHARAAFTGMFKQADFGLIRCSSVNEPHEPSSWSMVPYPAMVPMVGLKFFRDGQAPSGDLVLAYKKLGQSDHNFLKYGVSNHFTENAKWPASAAIQLFKKYSDYPTFSGLSEFASVGQDGNEVSDPRAPYVLLLLAPEKLRTRRVPMTKSLIDQFDSFRAGDIIYDMYAVPEPVAGGKAKRPPRQACTEDGVASCEFAPSIWRVGTLRLLAPFVSSSFGDKQLFFRHHLFDKDLQLRPDWRVSVDTMIGAPFYQACIEAGDLWEPAAAMRSRNAPDAMQSKIEMFKRQTENEEDVLSRSFSDAALDEISASFPASQCPFRSLSVKSAAPKKSIPSFFTCFSWCWAEAKSVPSTLPPNSTDVVSMYPAKITVFEVLACPHCKRLETLLEHLGWKYEVISLTYYPEKLGDMYALTNRTSVPQIFLNSKHIGGLSEFERLVDTAPDAAKLYEDIMKQPGPTDARLQKPDYEPKVEASAVSEPIICIAGQCLTFADLHADMTIGPHAIQVKDRKRLFGTRTYKKCFKGYDLVDWLVTRFKLSSRGDALQAGMQLFESNVFRRADHSEGGLEDDDSLYRFQVHENQLWKSLNATRGVCRTGENILDPASSVALLKKLSRGLLELRTAHTDRRGVEDCKAILLDPRFADFNRSSCDLQLVDLAKLDRSTRRAFTINLYNLLVWHALVTLGAPSTKGQRLAFLDGVRYQLGSHCFSLNDLESGVLRNNRHAPYHLKRPFSKEDERLKVALPVDYRVHFALNCGATSCPPISWHTADSLEEELDQAARAWVESDSNVLVATKTRTISVSKIIKWYEIDFGRDKKEIARTLAKHAVGNKARQLADVLDGKFALKYLPYNWNVNVKNAKPFIEECYSCIAIRK